MKCFTFTKEMRSGLEVEPLQATLANQGVEYDLIAQEVESAEYRRRMSSTYTTRARTRGMVLHMLGGLVVCTKVQWYIMLRIVVTRIAKSQLQGNCLRLRRFVIGYSPRIGINKRRSGQVRLQLVLVQKRTRLEFPRRKVGRLYTWMARNTTKETRYKYKETHHWLSKYSYIKGDGHQEVSD